MSDTTTCKDCKFCVKFTVSREITINSLDGSIIDKEKADIITPQNMYACKLQDDQKNLVDFSVGSINYMEIRDIYPLSDVKPRHSCRGYKSQISLDNKE